MSDLPIDLRYTLRGLARTPGFTAIALLSLAMGIGANTAIFSLLDRVLLRALPMRNPRELVVLKATDPRVGMVQTNYDSDFTFSYPMYRDFRDRAPVFDGVVAWFSVPASLAYRGQTDYVSAHMVTGNFFDVLGVGTILGRTLTSDDERAPGASPVVVLSHGFWTRRFGADPRILNETVTVSGHTMTVVGVASPGFSGLMIDDPPALYVPVTMQSEMMPGRNDLENRRASWLNVMARLKPGVSATSAESAMDAFWRPILQEEATQMSRIAADVRQRFLNRHISMVEGAYGISRLRDGFGAPLVLIMGLVGLVLLIACANVANLMLARAAGRQKEVAIRLALGAGRSRIVRQILTESATLSVCGGALGLLLALWTGPLLLHLLPFSSLGDAIPTDPDLRILGFTALIAISSGILFGLAPALQTAAPALAETLKQQTSSVAGSAIQVRYRKALVVAQVALSLLLLLGAGLFLRSVQNLKSIELGFKADHLISFSVDPSLNGYDESRGIALYDRLLAQIAALPGVRGASIAQTPLLSGGNWKSGISIPGRDPKDTDPTPNSDVIGAGYFSTLGTPVLNGREFTAGDGRSRPQVAVVNQTFVNLFFDGQNPIGKHFYFNRDKTKPVEVTGVVRDTKYASLTEKKQAFVFSPYAQNYHTGTMTLYIRTIQDPEAMISTLRKTVREADPNLPVFDIKTMNQQIDESVFQQRVISELSAFFGVLATLLASIGLYGVMSYVVTRRTREIGIRMALGANRRDVLRLMLGEVAVLIGIGVAIAVPAAYPLTQLTRSMLFGVGPHDPVVIAGAVALLAIVALTAAWIPAVRAARVEPMMALRND